MRITLKSLVCHVFKPNDVIVNIFVVVIVRFVVDISRARRM